MSADMARSQDNSGKKKRHTIKSQVGVEHAILRMRRYEAVWQTDRHHRRGREWGLRLGW